MSIHHRPQAHAVYPTTRPSNSITNMSTLSAEKPSAGSTSVYTDDDMDMTFHDPPSSPFVMHLDDQENIAPDAAPTPMKPIYEFQDVQQLAFKVSPEKKLGLKERESPMKMSPVKNLLGDFEEAARNGSPRKSSPVKQERPASALSSHSRKSMSPSVQETMLRENEGPTVAMEFMDEGRDERQETVAKQEHIESNDVLDLDMDNAEYNPDGPELTSGDIDDTGFSMFSEMPGIDMTKFASLRQSPARDATVDVSSRSTTTQKYSLTCKKATPRARAQMTPSTIRRTGRTPSPTPRRSYKENDTTNLLLDFTEQIQCFSQSRRTSPARGRSSPTKSSTQPDLRSYYQNQRSPAKGASYVPSTPSQSRQMMNLLDFELPPPPTPRSLPTVTIREMESVKSQFQSQISSLSASLSGKEAEVDSLAKAVADAERRVGEAHETVRDERSAREYAEAQMIDWKKKGEEVQSLLGDVQSELARNDAEREQLLLRLADAEKRADDAENRSSELETKVIEAESKNVDMTTFINNDDGEDNKKIYSELECQTAIAEKVNEVARDLHSAYKAKHEKKIKALKDNYQKKADERCKELRVQIIRLERQLEEAEKKRDNTFSKILPGGETVKTESHTSTTSSAADVQQLESQRAEIENLKAKLAGLQSELLSLRQSNDSLLVDLEAERVEKGELVAAAEQMLSMCGEKMEELQQEDFRRSQIGSAPPAAPKREAQGDHTMRNTGFLAGNSAPRPGSALGNDRPGSGMGDRLGAMNERPKPSGIRAPGGFGFGGPAQLNRSTSGGASKSRLLSNIERMGGNAAVKREQE